MNNQAAIEEKYKIIMVDDEEHSMVDYRKALRRGGHTVISVTTLDDAYHEINTTLKEDNLCFILLDLMLPGQPIPSDLSSYYGKVETSPHNQGQAIGQWLWHALRTNRYQREFYYCYFSNIPDFYLPNIDINEQEFIFSKDTVPNGNWATKFDALREQFVLDKTTIRPSGLFSHIERIAKTQASELNLMRTQVG